ncbi:MAG: ECF transporter S component [Oscillospiraceae bacterium]
MQTKHKTFTVKNICLIGMMSALVLIFTFIKIDIPTALGKTMLHFGNVMCLLSGLLFGPVVGGLSAGFGSMFFDLFDPIFAPECWVTFINKFAMGFIAGGISLVISRKKLPKVFYVLAAAAGSLSYTFLYLGKTFIEKRIIFGYETETVLIDLATKAITSGIGAVISVTAVSILFFLLRPALKRAKLFVLDE